MFSGGKGHKGRWAHRVISYESSSAATTTSATNGSTPGNNNNTNGSTSSGSTTLTGPCIHWHSSKLFSTERAGFSIRDITKVGTTTLPTCFYTTAMLS
jgi:hypothetical protein